MNFVSEMQGSRKRVEHRETVIFFDTEKRPWQTEGWARKSGISFPPKMEYKKRSSFSVSAGFKNRKIKFKRVCIR